MIGRVLGRGSRVSGLIWYLYGPGRACEHTNPHLVSGWRHPAEIEPPLRPGGSRDFRILNDLLMQPVTALAGRAPDLPVWHCVVRAATADPDLGDGAWMRIAGEIMHRTGLSRYGEEEDGVRWVAVHHGDNHIHIVATLARQDGRRAQPRNDYWRIGEALRDIEAEYGLEVVARADRTADRRATRAETEKAARASRAEPARATLRREVARAAAAARSEPEFFAALARSGIQARLRHSTRDPGEVTGYAVSLPGDQTAAGTPVWFGGGQLAPDLTLPKLRHRWPGPASRAPAGPGCLPGPGPPRAGRLHGHGMTGGAARAALHREVAQAAAAARSAPQFFAALQQAGLLTRIRYSPSRPGEAAGYAVSLPGLLHHQDGQQVWYGGHALAPGLTLPALRRRWRAGRPGAPPPDAAFDGASTHHIFGYAAGTTTAAAARIRADPGAGQAADIAWAAADLLTVAAAAAGSPQLQRAADSLTRAARAPWGRTPPPSTAGAGLRTAAYLLAACHPAGYRRSTAHTLITALAGLAAAVAELRQAQAQQARAAAARAAASQLTAIRVPAARPAQLAAADFPALLAGASLAPPQPGPARHRPGPAPPSPRRAR